MTGIDDLIICPQCLKPMSDEIGATTCKHCGYQEGNRFTINTLDGSIDLRDNGKPMTFRETVNLLNSLLKENEQLKQQIKQLQHWNKCLAEKRHNELKGDGE